MDSSALDTLRILYVEDETDVRRSVKEAIEPFVATVVEASDGEEGLEIFTSDPDAIDLIITDLLMPKRGGIDMIRNIRALGSTVPVIYTTAFADSEYLKQTIALDVTAYILKPIDIEALLHAIQKAAVLIENRQLHEQLEAANLRLQEKVQEKTSQLLQKNQELHHQLTTDALTGLPNRRALIETLKYAPSPAVLLADIDAFRTYNETYGEEVGNAILRSFGSFLNAFAKKRELETFRIGGDVFALFNPLCDDPRRCETIAQELLDALRTQEIILEKTPYRFRLGLSIGIALGSEKAIEKASMALKRAKTGPKNLLVYSPEYSFDSEYQHNRKWFDKIRDAIEQDRIRVYIQPIVDASSTTIKHEALVRIVEGNRIHTPGEFLDVAKKMKLYPELSRLILSKVLEIVRSTSCALSVNLTIENIEDEEFSRWLFENIRLFGVERLLTFEILEGENIHDYARMVDFMNRLQELGCEVAIDDFGSGYSNFVYLRRLQPDYIKIDGSLIKNIDRDHHAEAIVKAIHQFSHTLGIRTVAEFVHSQAVFEKLKSIGIDYFQGFYIARPFPSEALGEAPCSQ